MKGKLKSITLRSSQEAWHLDLPEIPEPSAPNGGEQPQAQPHQVRISTSNLSSHHAAQSAVHQDNKKGATTGSKPILDKDDDDFMPPMKQQASTKTTIRAPSVRCMPSMFNKFTDHLRMPARKKITQRGFGALLQFCADCPESSDLLVFLMERLNPDTMVLEVGNDGGREINEICVHNVLDLPIGDRDPPSSTEEENKRALIEFRKLVNVERNKAVTCNHLLYLMRNINLETDLAVRIFFVITFNKLLFPSVDNNVRGLDAFLTKDISQFQSINWCKAVVQELRHAAIEWRSESKKTIPGCGIFLIIFYVDNLMHRCPIDHLATPRSKFFHRRFMENIILQDKRIDKYGKETFGNLHSKNLEILATGTLNQRALSIACLRTVLHHQFTHVLKKLVCYCLKYQIRHQETRCQLA